MKECEATLSYGGNFGIIGNTGGLQRNVDNDGVLCELVKVGYRLEED